MVTTNRTESSTRRRRPGVLFGTALVSLALIAGACSKKDDGEDNSVGSTATTAAAPTTAAGGDTATTEGSTDTTEATETTEGGSTDTTEVTETTGGGSTDTTEGTDTTDGGTEGSLPDVSNVTPGGKLVVSGEAEVANAWTPAAMQCDSYCQQRARSFFDPVASLGDDNEVHGVLAETITPNDDNTEWTVKLREGISFTDGTPVDADAVIYNLQVSGSGLLIANALTDVAKVPSAADPSKTELKIEKVDDLTFTIFTGKGGDPAQPLPWPGFANYLTGQWGLIASPTWLKAVDADPSLATKPIGSGPFIVESYTPRDVLVVKKNPNYWQKDANGVQLPYLDEIDFKVIEDSQVAEEALQNGEIDIFSTSSAQVISDFREDPDNFPMNEQTDYVETNYILIDLDKPGPLQDSRVRCALSMAIDRQEIIDLVEGGITSVANGLFTPGQEGFLEDNGFDPAQNLDEAQKLIDEYKSETGTSDITVNYGHTATALGDQTAELLKGYWDQIGVSTEVQVVPQDKFITNALFGDPGFFMYGWRNHAGLKVDGQNYWWNSAAAPPDGQLALNFGRVRDDVVDENLAIARSDPDPAKRQEAAENINRQMAKECYQIPTSRTLWGTPHSPKVQGIGGTVLPDGTLARDGAGFSGQFWVTSLWIQE